MFLIRETSLTFIFSQWGFSVAGRVGLNWSRCRQL